LNPKISPRVERALLAAIAMHPGDRPTTVALFKGLLIGPSSLPEPLSALVPTEGEWRHALQQNRALFILALLALILAIIVTLVGPAASSAPEATTGSGLLALFSC
jgi:serine/threonine-protein kinase